MRVSRVISMAAAVVITATELAWLSSSAPLSAPEPPSAASPASETSAAPLPEIVVIGHR